LIDLPSVRTDSQKTELEESLQQAALFYGLKVQVVVTVEGLPVECYILSGGPSDVQELAELPLLCLRVRKWLLMLLTLITNGKTISLR
jgi:hypothetical protein